MEDIIKQMVMSPKASAETNTSTSKEKQPESKDEIVSLVLKGKTVGKKYREKLIKQATKDPNSVSIKVGKGWKTVKQAMEDGDLGSMPSKPDLEALTANLKPEMKAKIMSMLDPKTTDIPQEQLEQMGFGPGMAQEFLPKGQPAPAPAPAQPGGQPGGQQVPQDMIGQMMGGAS